MSACSEVEHWTGSCLLSLAHLWTKISQFHSYLFPLILPLPLFSASHRPVWAPTQRICFSLWAANSPPAHGTPNPSPHFTSQQNANVISALQAGER